MKDAKHVLQDLLKTASTELGIPLELSEENDCVITRADGKELVVGAEDGDETVWLFAPLFEVGANNREALFAWALQENVIQEHTRGAVIGIDTATDRFLLSHRVHVSILSGDRISQILSNLFELIDTISDVIAEKQIELAQGTTSTSTTEDKAASQTHHGFA